ncbi:MAG: hypothetical protein ACFWT5_10455 [Pseudomonas helleri]|jgi:hypothetical protein
MGCEAPQTAVLRPASQPSCLVSDYRELRRVGMAVDGGQFVGVSHRQCPALEQRFFNHHPVQVLVEATQ